MSERTGLIVPFNGSNYATWKLQCKVALMRDGLYSIVSGTEQIPTRAEEIPKFNLRKDRALSTIILAMEPSQLYLVGPDEEQNPNALWSKLETIYQQTSFSNRLTLRKKLTTLRLKNGESLQQHIKSLVEIFDQLAVGGHAVSNEDKVMTLLSSLPKSFDILVTALELRESTPSWDCVVERLYKEEA